MQTKTIPAASAKKSAMIFDIGNLVTIVLPVLIPFWFGASIFAYTFLRHHPNEKVGDYAQKAAYRFYALLGALIPVATFFPININYYLITWLVFSMIMVPLSIWALIKIKKDHWEDVHYTPEDTRINDPGDAQ